MGAVYGAKPLLSLCIASVKPLLTRERKKKKKKERALARPRPHVNAVEISMETNSYNQKYHSPKVFQKGRRLGDLLMTEKLIGAENLTLSKFFGPSLTNQRKI